MRLPDLFSIRRPFEDLKDKSHELLNKYTGPIIT